MTLYSQKCVSSENQTFSYITQCNYKIRKNLIQYCNLYSDFPNYLLKQLFPPPIRIQTYTIVYTWLSCLRSHLILEGFHSLSLILHRPCVGVCLNVFPCSDPGSALLQESHGRVWVLHRTPRRDPSPWLVMSPMMITWLRCCLPGLCSKTCLFPVK